MPDAIAIPGQDDIVAARRRIATDVRVTPLWRLPGAALGVDVAELWLKLEHLQIGGSFKARGMFNRIRSAVVPATGVVIASGGNAGIAAAAAARALGVRCEVFGLHRDGRPLRPHRRDGGRACALRRQGSR